MDDDEPALPHMPAPPEHVPEPVEQEHAPQQARAQPASSSSGAPSAKRKEREHWSGVGFGDEFNLEVDFPKHSTDKTVDVPMFRDNHTGISRSRIPGWSYDIKVEYRRAIPAVDWLAHALDATRPRRA